MATVKNSPSQKSTTLGVTSMQQTNGSVANKTPTQPSLPTTPRTTSKALSKNWNISLTDKQNEALVKIKSVVSERPIPSHIVVHSSTSLDEGIEDLVDENIENMQQFYAWFERLGEDTVTEEKYSTTIEALSIYKDYSSRILNEIDGALSYLENLENNYNLVSKKTSELHDACEVLVNQQNQLLRFADVMEKKLAYFNELPKITQKLSVSTISVYDESFKALLSKLDECIQFTNTNIEFMDSEVYLVKYKQLQSRALSLIKNEIISTIKSITMQIQSEIKSKGTATDASTIEKLYYIKFRSVAQKLKPLSEEIEKRISLSKDYLLLLQDCHNCYFVQRQILLNNIINSNVTLICKQSSDLVTMTRNGCLYLLGVCHNEYQLYSHFFTTFSTTLTILLEGFSSSLYESFRPIFIRSHNIENLCSLVYMLKTEIMSENLNKESVQDFKPIVDRMLQDVQERITFLAQTYIRDEITGYVPGAQDYEYPEKLKSDSGNSQGIKSLYKTWFPTLERTLVCLSKLYLTVNTQIFEGLATEAIGECTATLVAASKVIAQKKTPTDGILFLIRHLLTLREQITPFDATFSVTEHSLDFSHMKDAFRKVLASRSELFSFTSSNPFVNVMQNAVPNLESSQVDSRKDLERELKIAVEAFINSVTKTCTEPLLSFLTKSTAFLNVKGARNSVSSTSDLLRTQVFASPERVKQVLEEVKIRIEESLPQLLNQMRVYITNVATQNLLFRPIKDQIMESLKQLASLVNREYLPEDRGVIDLSIVDAINVKLESYVVVQREENKANF